MPLAYKATAMRIADTADIVQVWSGAVFLLIGYGLRQGDVNSTNKQHASNSNYAWNQNFNDGDQNNNNKDNGFRARAVRKLIRAIFYMLSVFFDWV